MKTFSLFLSLTFVAILSACSATGAIQPVSLATMQANITSLCPIVNADLTILSTSPTMTPDQRVLFTKVLADNQAFCAGSGNLTITSLQAFNTSVIGVLVPILTPMAAANPQAGALLLALQLAAPLVNQVINQATTPPGAAPAPAVSVPAKT